MRHDFLDEATARQIVQRTMSIIKHSVNVMDSTGTIIASGDASRVYQRHEGAVLALTENRVVEIDIATAHKLKGVKPGINLPIFLHSKVVGVVGVSGKPEEVREYAKLVKMAAELILEQVAVITENQWGKRYREELANQLISGNYDHAAVESMSAYLNLDLAQPRVVLILELDRADPERLKALLAYFADNEHDHLVTLTDFSELVLLKPITLRTGEWDLRLERKQIQMLLDRLQSFPIVRAVVGGYFPGVHRIHESYLSARATQEMAVKMKAKSRYLFYSEQSLPVLLNSLSEGWQARELAKCWQQLVASDRKGVLQTTLREYFAQNCDLAQTANRLHIHVNTLRYRLQKIELITHFKINELKSILWLYIGMQISG
jgi:carbohydrate diacid regulator